MVSAYCPLLDEDIDEESCLFEPLSLDILGLSTRNFLKTFYTLRGSDYFCQVDPPIPCRDMHERVHITDFALYIRIDNSRVPSTGSKVNLAVRFPIVQEDNSCTQFTRVRYSYMKSQPQVNLQPILSACSPSSEQS